ncbi:MAG TPA: ArsR family transcriptional regulator [Egibacteraceae bacterium]|nr:ArsR family transcriptional regulator [Egibacteraceae bacterium]
MRGGSDSTLVDLLGDTRGKVVDLLRAQTRSVAELAEQLEISEVAVRRHLQVLERDGLVDAETVRRDGPGRPGARYGLTDRARRLFPDRSAEFASELMDFLQREYGRSALLQFLRWRQEQQARRYGEAMAAAGPSSHQEQVAQLAHLLSDDGFLSTVTPVTAPDGATVLQLQQQHCAIREVARQHPEVCAYEAALFQRLLGAKVSRRQTIAGGASECICNITEKTTSTSSPNPGAHHGDAR